MHIAQDSFGTAANISGDNAIALVIDKIYHKFIKDKATPSTQ
jgi:Na+/H+-dicarboxylate symporter